MMPRLVMLVAMLALPAVVAGQDWDPPRPPASAGRGGDGVRILVGRSLHVPAGAVQRDAIVVLGGSLSIDGRVEDDVVVLGGRLRLGPTAVIRGDLASLGAAAEIDPQARIDGELNQVSGTWPVEGIGVPTEPWWWAVFAFILTIARFTLSLILTALVTLVAPRWMRDAGRESGHAAGASLLTGWAVQILFVPAVIAVTVALTFSVIGIPLVAAVPLLFMALTVVWVAGFAATAARAGRAVRGRQVEPADPSPIDTAAGVVLFGLVTFAGHVLTLGPAWLLPIGVATVLAGLAIEYVAWTIGLGAAMRTLLSRWRGGAPLPQAAFQPVQ
jgi:hypothetical protein